MSSLKPIADLIDVAAPLVGDFMGQTAPSDFTFTASYSGARTVRGGIPVISDAVAHGLTIPPLASKNPVTFNQYCSQYALIDSWTLPTDEEPPDNVHMIPVEASHSFNDGTNIHPTPLSNLLFPVVYSSNANTTLRNLPMKLWGGYRTGLYYLFRVCAPPGVTGQLRIYFTNDAAFSQDGLSDTLLPNWILDYDGDTDLAVHIPHSDTQLITSGAPDFPGYLAVVQVSAATQVGTEAIAPVLLTFLKPDQSLECYYPLTNQLTTMALTAQGGYYKPWEPPAAAEKTALSTHYTPKSGKGKYRVKHLGTASLTNTDAGRSSKVKEDTCACEADPFSPLRPPDAIMLGPTTIQQIAQTDCYKDFPSLCRMAYINATAPVVQGYPALPQAFAAFFQFFRGGMRHWCGSSYFQTITTSTLFQNFTIIRSADGVWMHLPYRGYHAVAYLTGTGLYGSDLTQVLNRPLTNTAPTGTIPLISAAADDAQFFRLTVPKIYLAADAPAPFTPPARAAFRTAVKTLYAPPVPSSSSPTR
jgi:hypothetical protein